MPGDTLADAIKSGYVNPADVGNLYSPGEWQNIGRGYGGSGMPDWGSLIGGDYEVQFAETEMASQMARARADYRRRVNQGLIDLGITDPSQVGGLGQYIDADTITKAAQNKYSTYAQIAQQEARSKAQSSASLAARGILTSGQTTKNFEDITASAESNRYQGLREYLGGADEGLMALADRESELAWRVAQARSAAASRAAQLYSGWQPYGGDAWPGPEDFTDWSDTGATDLRGGSAIAPAGSAATQAARAAAERQWRLEHGYVG